MLFGKNEVRNVIEWQGNNDNVFIHKMEILRYKILTVDKHMIPEFRFLEPTED